MERPGDEGNHDIVIIGGGIQSACIAYYLMKSAVKCTIIEEVDIAAAASGKAGGFLAKNWGDATTSSLHELSYELHEQLAEELNLESYRQISTMKVSRNSGYKKRKLDTEMPVSWVDKNGVVEVMDAHFTAQVCPMELTSKMFGEAIAFGSNIIFGRVCGICLEECGDGKRVRGVKYVRLGQCEEIILEASKVVIATGPWAGVHSQDWLGVNIPIQGIKATSMVYKNCPRIVLDEPYALFCDADDNGCELEIYPRPNGEIYICGCGDSEVLGGDQLRPGGEAMNASLIHPHSTRAHAAARSFSTMSSLGERWADVSQACMLPYSEDGLPVMGAFDDIEGAYISSGHNCWGILWAPISGVCMSDVIVSGTSSHLDISQFRPGRFI